MTTRGAAEEVNDIHHQIKNRVEEPLMEYQFTNLPDWFARYTVRILDDKYVMRYKNLLSDIESENLYVNLSNKIVKGKQGNALWSSVATTLILVTGIAFLAIRTISPIWLGYQATQTLLLLASILSIMFFVLRFIKEEYVWFYDKNNTYEFGIKISGRNREQAEQFVNLLLEKIQKANS